MIEMNECLEWLGRNERNELNMYALNEWIEWMKVKATEIQWNELNQWNPMNEMQCNE